MRRDAWNPDGFCPQREDPGPDPRDARGKETLYSGGRDRPAFRSSPRLRTLSGRPGNAAARGHYRDQGVSFPRNLLTVLRYRWENYSRERPRDAKGAFTETFWQNWKSPLRVIFPLCRSASYSERSERVGSTLADSTLSLYSLSPVSPGSRKKRRKSLKHVFWIIWIKLRQSECKRQDSVLNAGPCSPEPDGKQDYFYFEPTERRRQKFRTRKLSEYAVA